MLQAGQRPQARGATPSWVTLRKSVPSADLRDLRALPPRSECAHERAGSRRGQSHGPVSLPSCHAPPTWEIGCLLERCVSRSVDPAKPDATWRWCSDLVGSSLRCDCNGGGGMSARSQQQGGGWERHPGAGPAGSRCCRLGRCAFSGPLCFAVLHRLFCLHGLGSLSLCLLSPVTTVQEFPLPPFLHPLFTRAL